MIASYTCKYHESSSIFYCFAHLPNFFFLIKINKLVDSNMVLEPFTYVSFYINQWLPIIWQDEYVSKIIENYVT